MPKRTETHRIRVKSLEKGVKKPLRVVFTYNKGCEACIETEGKNILLYNPGKTYDGIFTVSGIPDFEGQKDEWENVCTISYYLDKIMDKEKVIYENK